MAYALRRKGKQKHLFKEKLPGRIVVVVKKEKWGDNTAQSPTPEADAQVSSLTRWKDLSVRSGSKEGFLAPIPRSCAGFDSSEDSLLTHSATVQSVLVWNSATENKFAP